MSTCFKNFVGFRVPMSVNASRLENIWNIKRSIVPISMSSPTKFLTWPWNNPILYAVPMVFLINPWTVSLNCVACCMHVCFLSIFQSNRMRIKYMWAKMHTYLNCKKGIFDYEKYWSEKAWEQKKEKNIVFFYVKCQ